MVIITKEVYGEIKIDIPKIEIVLSSRNGSEVLWSQLRSKFSILLPDIMVHVRESGELVPLEWSLTTDLNLNS